MQVLLTPTGPIPAWASRCGGSLANRARLQARSTAVRRVRARARHALPDREDVVDLERAEPALVADARSTRSSARRPCSARRTCTARSPARRSPACAGPATATTRSGSARPRRSATTRPAAAPSARCACPRRCASKILKTSPETFLRGVFCLNTVGQAADRHRGLATSAAAATRSSTSPATRTIPYTRGGSRPPLSRTNSGEITIGVASRLTRLLDQAARAKRIPAKLPIHYTEHGWQTNRRT